MASKKKEPVPVTEKHDDEPGPHQGLPLAIALAAWPHGWAGLAPKLPVVSHITEAAGILAVPEDITFPVEANSTYRFGSEH